MGIFNNRRSYRSSRGSGTGFLNPIILLLVILVCGRYLYLNANNSSDDSPNSSLPNIELPDIDSIIGGDENPEGNSEGNTPASPSPIQPPPAVNYGKDAVIAALPPGIAPARQSRTAAPKTAEEVPKPVTAAPTQARNTITISTPDPYGGSVLRATPNGQILVGMVPDGSVLNILGGGWNGQWVNVAYADSSGSFEGWVFVP